MCLRIAKVDQHSVAHELRDKAAETLHGLGNTLLVAADNLAEFGRTVSSMSFSRKTASYFPRPRLRSQTATSMGGPKLRVAAHHRVVRGECPGGQELLVTGVTWAIRRAPGGFVDTVKRISFP
jgi:hypothetical protein